MLLHLTFFLFNFFSPSVPAAPPATSYSVANLPAELQENAYAVYRKNETVFTIKSPGSAVLKHHYAVTILDKNADDKNVVTVYYDKFRKVNYLKGTLYDKFGKKIKELKKSDIQDVVATSSISLMEDNRVKAARLIGAQYPYTVEFEYELSFTGLLHYPTWQPQDEHFLSVQEATFQVISPNDLGFRHKSVLTNEPVLTKQPTHTAYSWQVKNLPARENFPFEPAFEELVPTVFSAPTTFEMDGYKGQMTDWKSYGNWINQLNAGKDKLPDATVTKLKALVANEPTEQAKVQKLYEYLQANTRYVSIQLGIGGWQPFEAGFVDSKGYGDCKALSNYMHAMLKAVGIKSNYALIRAGEGEQDILTDFPSTQFNHAVLCVPMAQDSIWLECTSQTESSGYAGSFTGNRHALLITPEGGKLVKTPKYLASDNNQVRNATIKLDAGGNGKATIQTTYTCLLQDDLSHIYELGAETQKKWLYNQITVPSFTLNTFNYKKQKGKIPQVTENLDLTISRCATLSGKRLFLTPNLLHQFQNPLPKSAERKTDIVMQLPSVKTDVVRFQLPKGFFQPESLPVDQHIKSAFGEYSASVKLENGEIIYTRTFKTNSGRFPASKYPELEDFYRKITKADKAQIVLNSNT